MTGIIILLIMIIGLLGYIASVLTDIAHKLY